MKFAAVVAKCLPFTKYFFKWTKRDSCSRHLKSCAVSFEVKTLSFFGSVDCIHWSLQQVCGLKCSACMAAISSRAEENEVILTKCLQVRSRRVQLREL